MVTETVAIVLERVSCCVCGAAYAVEQGYHAQLLKVRGRETYCPNGHKWHYTGLSEAEQLKRQLEMVRGVRDAQRSRAERAERSQAALRGVVTRTKRRIAAGRCPCCQVKFADLGAHMTKTHPEYTAD
jgi:hypothetical protein